MFCSNCGNKIEPGQNFCPNCGTKISNEIINDINYSEEPIFKGPIKNYMWQSILVTLCCCLPFGILAILNAAKVEERISNGDYKGAIEASNKAKMWCIIGFICGLIGVPFGIFINLLGHL